VRWRFAYRSYSSYVAAIVAYATSIPLLIVSTIAFAARSGSSKRSGSAIGSITGRKSAWYPCARKKGNVPIVAETRFFIASYTNRI
jgi:hypothetical protein